MAVGDSDNILGRLVSLVPGGWFSRAATIRDAVLGGLADSLANIYSLIGTIKNQARIRTASGWVLDLIAWDFFGPDLVRYSGETDSQFRTRILANIFLPKLTRAAIQASIENLTGYPARVIEPFALSDVGFWKVRGGGSVTPISFYGVDNQQTPARWSLRGTAFQFFVECSLPAQHPLGYNAPPTWATRGNGSNSYAANWMTRGTAAARQWGSSWISRNDFVGLDASTALYSLIDSMKAAGIIAWVKIVPPPTTLQWDQPGLQWDVPGENWDS